MTIPIGKNISKAALPALWQADPAFREIAKYLYGDDVTLETIQKDLFGKSDPGPADVHVEQPVKVGRKKKPLVVDERGIEKNLEVIGKSFVELVEKAYDAGLIDDEGNLDMVEIEKSRTYVRDHAGKFASQGKHTGKMVAGIAAAGALAGVGAALGAKSPKALKYAGESVNFVTHHLKSADPVERHVARSLLPHALKATGKAVGQAGLGATASAGAVYEGTRTYNDFRNRAVHGTKAARLEDVEKLSALALRAGAEYVSRGTQVAGHIAGYGPKHAARLTRLKRLRGLVGDKVKETALDPTAPAHALRDLTKPMGDITKRNQYRDSNGRFASGGTRANIRETAAGVGGVAVPVGGLVALGGHAETKDVKRWANDAEQRKGHAMLGDALGEPYDQEQHVRTLSTGERAMARNAPTSWAEEAERAGHEIKELGQRAKQARRWRAGGAAAALGGAALIGAAVYDEKHHKVTAKKNADEHDVVWEGDFSKVDEDKQQVFGWASVTELDGKPVVDLQGDYIHPDDIEKAAYDYVLKSRVGGDMHTRVDEYGNVIEKADKALHVSDLIESMVFTPEKCEAMGVSKNLAGRWWTGFQINDPDIWTEVKEGRRTGFSIHGAGLRKSIDITELDPEAELIGKAYQESENMSQFIDNLVTLEDVTGHEGFGDLAKHLAHGITAPQINAQQGRNAGVYGSMGSGVGGLAGGAIGAKLGHVGEGAGIGATVGGLTGTAFGVHHGSNKPQRPQRPPSLQGMGMKAASYVEKAVDNTNRMGGSVGVRQNMYQQQALQEATQMLAPQVAQHIQAMQEQRWQQQMMEQQMLAQQAQQQPQNFAVQMGPYANTKQGGQSQGNPLAPSQQGPSVGAEPEMPHVPQTFSV